MAFKPRRRPRRALNFVAAAAARRGAGGSARARVSRRHPDPARRWRTFGWQLLSLCRCWCCCRSLSWRTAWTTGSPSLHHKVTPACQCCRLSFTCALTGCVCLAGRVMAAALAGWRSWNSYTCQDSTNTTFTGGDIISDAAMRTAMHAVLDTSRSVQGVSTTLASLGYDYISMDDGWQQCNCSTHQDIDPTLPSCSIGDCRGGRCSWHDKPSGAPMVNKHRFPRYKRTQIFCAILYYKMIILARQARDKHRQNSNGDAFSSVPAA